MSANQVSSDFEREFIKYMASFDNVKNMTSLRKTEADIVNVDSDVSDGDDIQIVEELTIIPEKHRCEICNEGAFLIDKLLRFGGLINEKYKYVCYKCDKNFEQKSQMKDHLAKCEGPENFRPINSSPAISQSSVSPATPQNVRASQMKEHEQIMCKICFKIFKSQRGLTKHTNNLHSGATHTCEICKTTFSSYLQFRHHCSEHQVLSKNYVCTSCGRSFHSSANLKKHAKCHKNPVVETIITSD